MEFLAVLEQRLDEGKEIGGLERFGDIGVGAYAEAFDLVLYGDFGGDENDGYVAQLQVSLDGLAEFITAHSGHHHVAYDQARGFVDHALQGRCSVEVDGYVVIRGEEDFHIVGDIDVVVHDGDTFLVRFFRVLRDSYVGSGLRKDDFLRVFRTLVLRIRGCACREDEAEDSATFRPVPGLDISVMKVSQGAGVIKAYSRALRISLVSGLVEALEYLFRLSGGDTAPAVGDCYASPLSIAVLLRQRIPVGGFIPSQDIEGKGNLPSCRSKFEGICKQVHDYLPDLVHVCPHDEGVFEAIRCKFDPFGPGVEPEHFRY